jgi:hypothetical protein
MHTYCEALYVAVFSIYYWGDKPKEYETSGTFTIYGRDKELIENFSRNILEKRLLKLILKK